MSVEPRTVNILIVDDQPSNLLALEALLEEPGYRLVRAPTGQDALRALLHDDFAVVLLDVVMPGMDGFETAAAIHQRQRSSVTPIIFVTASNTSETHVSRGYRLGAVDYIAKPIVPEMLRAKVRVFVELFRTTAELREQGETLRKAKGGLRRQLAERERAEQALRDSEGRYRALFSAVGDPLVVFDRLTGEVVGANAAAARLSGYPRGKLLKLTAEALFGSRSGRASSAAEAAWLFETSLRRRDGTAVPVEISLGAFTHCARDLTIALIRDITDRQRAEEADRLRERERLQRQFIATVSHELRTPIAAIKGFTETLRRGGMEDTRNRGRFVRIIEKHADRLGAIVEELLAINAVESGTQRPDARRVDVSAFLGRLIDELAPVAARRRVRLGLRAAPGLEAWADEEQLGRVLQNLIENAIKYNRPGGRVDIEARPEDGRARVTVSDTGIGIAAAELPLIFQQFHRSARAKELGIPGTGLGLSIVQRLIEANGGRVWAESRPDEGSSFHLTLPASAEDAPAVPADRSAAPSLELV